MDADANKNLLFTVQTHIDTSTKLHKELAIIAAKLQEAEKRANRWSFNLITHVGAVGFVFMVAGYALAKMP